MSMSPTASRLLDWRERHASLTDGSLTFVLALLSLLLVLNAPQQGLGSVEASIGSPAASWALPLNALLILTCTLSIAWRAYAPRLVWAVLTLTPLLHVLLAQLWWQPGPWPVLLEGYAAIAILAIPLQIATLARRLRLRWITLTVLVSSLSISLAALLAAEIALKKLLQVLPPFLLINIIGALVGLLLAYHKRQLNTVRQDAARSALEQEQSMLLASARERSRIARDMHDIVAHSLAVMITMADGAAASLDRNPDATREALTILSETGRCALADTRRLVGVLRHDPASVSSLASVPEHSEATDDAAAVPRVRDLPVPEFAPPGTIARQDTPPQVANLRAQAVDETQEEAFTAFSPVPQAHEIEHLVERFRAAGVPATYRWEGAELPDNPGLNLALYRIAQEALTNVLRYAPRTPRVSVEVIRSLGRVELVVCNDAAPGTEAMPGSGKGIIGMRERAAAYQGRVEAGPTATGWRVQASLHWDESEHSTHTWEVPR